MAKEDLTNVKDIVETASETAEHVPGKILVDFDNIRAHLDTFNETYQTSFTATTPAHEIQEYFTTYYVELIQRVMYKKTNPQRAFNHHFDGYAKIEI